MEPNEHSAFEDIIEVKSLSLSKEKSADNLFISSYSNYSPLHQPFHPIANDVNLNHNHKHNNKQHSHSHLPHSPKQNVNIEDIDFEENFNSVFQTSHESDEYSAGFVRMLYMKYISTISSNCNCNCNDNDNGYLNNDNNNNDHHHPNDNDQSPQYNRTSNNNKTNDDNYNSGASVLSDETSETKSKEKDNNNINEDIIRDTPLDTVIHNEGNEGNVTIDKLTKIKTIPILSKGVFTAHVMRDGTLAFGSWGNSLFFYNPLTEETIESPGHSGWVKYIIPIDNNRIASCSEDSTLKIWDDTTYDCLGTFKAEFATEGLMSIAQLSTDRIICGSSDGILFIWDIANSILIDSLQASESGIFVIMPINDNQIMIGSFDDHIYILRLTPSLAQIGKLEGHTGWAKPLLRFRAHDLVSSGEDGVLKLWDIDTLTCYHTLYGHKGGVWSGIVKNDSVLFTGSGDCTIRIWNLNTYQCITVISELSTVTALIELPGNRLIAGTFNNELTLYRFH